MSRPASRLSAAVEPPSGIHRRWRTVAWLLAIILAFVLGFLLSRHRVPNVAPSACPGASSATAPQAVAENGGRMVGGAPATGEPTTPPGGGAGDGGPVGGDSAKPGGDDAAVQPGGGSSGGEPPTGVLGGGGDPAAASDAPGQITSHPTDGEAMDGGGGAGQPVGGEGETRGGALAPNSAGNGAMTAQTGTLSPGGDAPDMPIEPDEPGGRVVGARDFSYDRSALPRYPGGVGKVASAMALPPGGEVSDRNSTLAEILTDDPPESVAAWYRARLPPDWVEEAPPSDPQIQQAAREVNSHPSSDTPVDAMLKAIMGPQLQQAQAGLAKLRESQLTMFWPPNRTSDGRSVLILRDKKTGKTAVLLGKKRPGT